MKRVASLYLPNWSIDRVRQAERQHTPPERAPGGGLDARIDEELAALKRAGAAEQGGTQCDAPRNSGWRPGARWARSEAAAGRSKQGVERGGEHHAHDARADVEQRIAQMNAHQRPPMREMGRRSEAADHAFKRLPADDGGTASRGPGSHGLGSHGLRSDPAPMSAPGTAAGMVAVRFGGEGVRPTSGQRRCGGSGVEQAQNPRAHDEPRDVRAPSPTAVVTDAVDRATVATTLAPPGIDVPAAERRSSNTNRLDSTSRLAVPHETRGTPDQVRGGGSSRSSPAPNTHPATPARDCPPLVILGTHDHATAPVCDYQSGVVTRSENRPAAALSMTPQLGDRARATSAAMRDATALPPAHDHASCVTTLDLGTPVLASAVGEAPLLIAPQVKHAQPRAGLSPAGDGSADHAAAASMTVAAYRSAPPALRLVAEPVVLVSGVTDRSSSATEAARVTETRHQDQFASGKSMSGTDSVRRHAGGRVGSNDAGARVRPVEPFFDTGRSTAGTVARVCPAETARPARALPVSAAAHAPLVTVHKIGSRVEIAAACPAARACGIEPGMALTQVRAASPGIAVRDADPVGDRAALDRLATTLARRWSPCVAISDADGLFIDLTGVAHLHGGEARMARRIVRLLARLGFAARVGVADTPAAAWALARYGETGTRATAVALLPPGHGLAPFADHPVAALRLEAPAIELMRRLGIDRVAQLAALPRAPMTRRFGRAVAARLDQVTGAVAEPLDPVIPEEPVTVEQRFAEPIMTAEPIAHWMAHLTAGLAQALRAQGRGARMLALALTRVDGEVQVVRVGFARATRDPAHVLRLLARRIETIDPGFGIEIMALHVTRGEPLGPEALAGDLERAVPDLAALVDAIVNRIGAEKLWRARVVESDVPERSVASTAPLDQASGAGARLTDNDVRHLDTREIAHPWHPRWPRPARLLRRPEPIDHVMAELPDSYPRRFRWRGQMHQVVCGDGPERITGEWWRRVAERQAVRDYFQVEDEAGQRFWLFRRGDGQRVETGDMTWFIHGTFA
jgi:protein ImuB